LGALAPRPVFVSAPLRDDNFRAASAAEVVRAAAAVYQLLGSPENLVLEQPDCGHDFPSEVRERAYRWLERHLSARDRISNQGDARADRVIR
ncbi:MAG: hypothetical protein RMK20_10555, partial [Verrucomicrobiales bacterium]|nr:hypothetical protein [Verrucomicrobiales bacterium]